MCKLLKYDDIYVKNLKKQYGCQSGRVSWVKDKPNVENNTL